LLAVRCIAWLGVEKTENVIESVYNALLSDLAFVCLRSCKTADNRDQPVELYAALSREIISDGRSGMPLSELCFGRTRRRCSVDDGDQQLRTETE
jgi:hypothetical protein